MLGPEATHTVLTALVSQAAINSGIIDDTMSYEDGAESVQNFFRDVGVDPDSLMSWINEDARMTYELFIRGKKENRQSTENHLALQLMQGFEMGIRYMIWRQQELELGHEV